MATIKTGIEIAVRHPETGSNLLGRTFAKQMNNAPWIDKQKKLQFCTSFLTAILDPSVLKSIDEFLLDRIEKKPLEMGIRLIKRYPSDGIMVLVALLMKELTGNQNFSESELLQFQQVLIESFFPERHEQLIETTFN